MDNDVVEMYASIIEDFLQNRMDATAFEARYLDEFKNELRELSPATFQILDTLFADVDAYCADPGLRDERDLDEDQLRERCAEAFTKLRRLQAVE